MFSKKIIIGLVILVVILIGAGIWVGVYLASARSSAASPYSAVIMSSGDMYFGKLSWFPSPHMTNVVLLQRTVDDKNQTQLSLLPYPKVVWGPVDYISLNAKNIISWSSIRSDSQMVKAIEDPASFSNAPASASQAPSSGGASSSTFKGPSTPPPGQ